jgi:hypothetical protein
MQRIYCAAGGVAAGSFSVLAGATPGIIGAEFTTPAAASFMLIP